MEPGTPVPVLVLVLVLMLLLTSPGLGTTLIETLVKCVFVDAFCCCVVCEFREFKRFWMEGSLTGLLS